jgi:hypothetical protein
MARTPVHFSGRDGSKRFCGLPTRLAPPQPRRRHGGRRVQRRTPRPWPQFDSRE